jgi:hypothetical protein
MKNDKKKYFRYRSDVQADNRMATYFEYVIYTDEFQSEVKKIREFFDIPEKGIEEFPTITNSNDPDEVFDNTNFDIPERFNTQKFFNEIAGLCNKFGFDSDSWLMLFSEYVVFGYYDSFNFGKSYGLYNINNDAKNNFKFSKEYCKTYPIAILIDPYTSLTELKDILDKRYKDTIEPMQIKLRDPESKMLTIRKTKENLVPIYNIIKNNIKLSTKTIAGKINKKFNLNWDYTRVNKIIRQKKYRKDS